MTMKELISKLREANHAYYDLDDPIMFDREYNELYEQLEQMENETGIIMSDSPTQKVQGTVLPGFTKVTHSEPMLSAAKTKSSADLVKFVGEQEVIVTYKLDGLTIVLMYDGGELEKAVTRGNGTEGEDVTEQIRCISGVTLKIPFTDKLVLRGECVLSWDDFNRIKDNLTEKGKPCGHPRNIAAGSVRQLDTSAVIRELQFIAFSMNEGSAVEFGTKSEQMAFLNKNGFITVHQLKCRYIPAAKKHTKTEMEHCIDGMKPEDCPYPVDGLIFEYDFVDYGRSLGGTSHHNNNMIAFKWSDETYTTTFRGIDYRATRTGVISMTALFDPVEINHTTVSRALIPNVDYFNELHLGIGDHIEVYKANMIIPQIDSNITKSGTYELAKTCPCCGNRLIIKETDNSHFLFCDSPFCDSQMIRTLEHFCKKDYMNIEGMSEATIEKLWNETFLFDFVSIYHLKQYESEIIHMSGFGQQAFNKLWKAIENSRHTTLNRVIAALGIPNIGRTAGREISEHFGGDEKDFTKAVTSGYDFTVLRDFGQTMQDNLIAWFADQNNLAKWENLLNELDIEKPAPKTAAKLPLDGMTIVPTGTLENFTRSDIKAAIEANGGKCGSSVSSKTTYVLVGENSGSKYTKGKSLGIPIITEEDFLRMIK